MGWTARVGAAAGLAALLAGCYDIEGPHHRPRIQSVMPIVQGQQIALEAWTNVPTYCYVKPMAQDPFGIDNEWGWRDYGFSGGTHHLTQVPESDGVFQQYAAGGFILAFSEATVCERDGRESPYYYNNFTVWFPASPYGTVRPRVSPER